MTSKPKNPCTANGFERYGISWRTKKRQTNRPVRGCDLSKFPFAIFYRFDRDKELIRVYRVLDLRRDPLWIRERLR
jgi:hypothetical protein